MTITITEAIFEDDPYPYQIILATSWAEADKLGIEGKEDTRFFTCYDPAYGVFLKGDMLRSWINEHIGGRALILTYPCIAIKFESLADAYVFKCWWS